MSIVKYVLKVLVFGHFSLLCHSAIAEEKPINSLLSSCAACHGANGIASNSDWPSLAGQKQGYLLNQLRAFKSGERKNVLMTGQLTQFSDEQLNEIALHYSQLTFVKTQASNINTKGENVRANCVSCHGMTGETVNDTWPNLAGQNKGYLFNQLMQFKSGERHSIIMNVIGDELNEQQMKDVAQYYQQIGTPK